MWVPTRDDAVHMFARHFEACHRSGAVERAKQKTVSLKAKGDHEGHKSGRMSLAGSRRCDRGIGSRSDGLKNGHKASDKRESWKAKPDKYEK